MVVVVIASAVVVVVVVAVVVVVVVAAAVVVVVVVIVVIVVHHCQNPEQYSTFILPYHMHMLEVVNYTTGNYESGVGCNDKFSILS